MQSWYIISHFLNKLNFLKKYSALYKRINPFMPKTQTTHSKALNLIKKTYIQPVLKMPKEWPKTCA